MASAIETSMNIKHNHKLVVVLIIYIYEDKNS